MRCVHWYTIHMHINIHKTYCLLSRYSQVLMLLQMATEFCMNFNSKLNRKKLVQALFSVSKNRLLVMDALYM